jgi:hypothetical protein
VIAFIGVELHQGGVELFELQPPTREPIGMLQRQIDLIDGDARDLHPCARTGLLFTTMLPVWALAMKAACASRSLSRG